LSSAQNKRWKISILGKSSSLFFVLRKRIELIKVSTKFFSNLIDAVPVTISLEYITAKTRPFSVNIEVQNSCILGEPIPLLYHIHNKSDHLQRVEALVPDSEAFLITGSTKIVLEMLPRSSKTLEYLIVPVIVGKQKAPSCLLKCVTTEENLLDSEEAVITYVYPQK
jgi:hypothetical protein